MPLNGSLSIFYVASAALLQERMHTLLKITRAGPCEKIRPSEPSHIAYMGNSVLWDHLMERSYHTRVLVQELFH